MSEPAATFRQSAAHRAELRAAADKLFALFERSLDPAGGFLALGTDGQPMQDAPNGPRALHEATRTVHAFAIAQLLERPGAGRIVEHGLRFVTERHRDPDHGGFFWSVDAAGPVDDTKQAYGHAFVLLAGASAAVAASPHGAALLLEADQLLDLRFWEEDRGAAADGFTRDWAPLSPYRGQNSNMHLTEALMAAFEATGERRHLDRAERIAAFLIQRFAAGLAWRVPEHFRADWTLDRDFAGDEMFRPAGMTPGHWLEWSRLLLQLWVLGDHRHDWMPDAAERLFRNAFRFGWDEQHGGFFYTLDFEDRPVMREKLWWPVAEALAAAHWLCEHRPDAFHEDAYERCWRFAAAHLIDPATGGWRPELRQDLRPANRLFRGFPDIYHALQAVLIPLYPATGSLTAAIAAAR